MKLYKIFLPKRYNGGELIPIKLIMKIAEEIEERFGAYSLNPFAFLPLIQGSWKDGIGEAYKEKMFLLELFIEDTFKNQEWIKAYKTLIKQKLDQKEIFIIEQNAEIV